MSSGRQKQRFARITEKLLGQNRGQKIRAWVDLAHCCAIFLCNLGIEIDEMK